MANDWMDRAFWSRSRDRRPRVRPIDGDDREANLPDGIPAGAVGVAVLQAAEGADPVEVARASIVVRPVVEAAPRHHVSQDGEGRIAIVAHPDLGPEQSAELLLNGAGAALEPIPAFALPESLRFEIARDLLKGLGRGKLTTELRDALAAGGCAVSGDATLSEVARREAWRISDDGMDLAIRQVRGSAVVFHGLDPDDSPFATVFAAPGVPPRDYLVRLRIGGADGAETSTLRALGLLKYLWSATLYSTLR